MSKRWVALVCLLGIVGCGPKTAPEETSGSPKHRVTLAPDNFDSWPADNVAKPEFTGCVEREVTSQDGRQCFYMVPDWANPVDHFSFKGPKGGYVWFAFSKRDLELAGDDEKQIQALLSKGNQPNQTLVVARPWRGWFGESDSEKGRLRIYTLFHQEDELEIHGEWKKGDEEAAKESQAMVGYILYSVKSASNPAKK